MPQVQVTIDTTTRDALEACRISMARSSILEFIKFMFEKDGRTFHVGRHTRKMAARVDRALTDLFEYGRSSYVTCSVPIRHGKSDLFSRYFAPYVIGKYATEPFKSRFNKMNFPVEFILSTHTADLSKLFSREARQILTHPAYQLIWPGVALSREASAVADWQTVDNSVDNKIKALQKFGDQAQHASELVTAKMQAVGIGGSINGRGGLCVICDDLVKNREEAESQTTRDKAWNALTNDLMTRVAPVHIIFLIGTRWHMDDPIGRVKEKNNPEDPKYDPEFPQYDNLDFKARNDDGSYLFPERFPPEWYIAQFANLGAYSAAALLQSEPVAKGGNMLPTDKINYIDSLPLSVLDQALYCRFWDLASSEKEVSRDDPDYTAGPKGFIHFEGAHPSDSEDVLKQKMLFFVTDLRAAQLEAIRRDRMIIDAAKADGARTWQGIEAQGGYKDAATTLQTVLKGISVVHRINVSRDKFSRITDTLHVPMDNGQIYFLRGPWNGVASQQLSQFPSGKHDDIPDALSGLFKMCWDRALVALRSGYVGGAGFSSGRGRIQRRKKAAITVSIPDGVEVKDAT